MWPGTLPTVFGPMVITRSNPQHPIAMRRRTQHHPNCHCGVGFELDTRREQAEVHKLTFCPDPSTHNHCTLDGMIGNNSCGTRSLPAEKTVDNVEELEVRVASKNSNDDQILVQECPAQISFSIF